MYPIPRAGALIDGSKTIHAAVVYRKDLDAPLLNKDKRNTLMYKGDEKWELMMDEEVNQKYVTDDLRMSVVYRYVSNIGITA
jgi:hypothetical protein